MQQRPRRARPAAAVSRVGNAGQGICSAFCFASAFCFSSAFWFSRRTTPEPEYSPSAAHRLARLSDRLRGSGRDAAVAMEPFPIAAHAPTGAEPWHERGQLRGYRSSMVNQYGGGVKKPAEAG
jgi:hypothetical protein